MSIKLRIFFGSVFALLLLAVACFTNPMTGKKSLVLVSDEVMNSMGEQAYAEVSAQSRLSNDSRLTGITERAAKRIAQASGEKFPWEFKLAESKEANAFCLPGGKIMVYTGILKPSQNEAALAFVLGHEVAHAVARHGAQRMSQGILTEAALITLGETALRQNPNRGEILAAIGLGAQVGIMLPYSRSHESEADYMGLLYTAQAGYDPREAPKFWARMAKSGAEPPEFLSTHPASGRRQRDLNQEMPKALELYQKAPVKYGEGERF